MEIKDDKLNNSDSLDVEEIKRQRDEYLNGWKRAQADLINFKKEVQDKMSEALKFGGSGVVGDMLNVFDSFERAIKSEIDKEGLEAIKDQMMKSLEGHGVKKIKSLGEKFDPRWHEAVSEVEDETKESQVIVEEIQSGFCLYEKVIRPAKVIIVK